MENDKSSVKETQTRETEVSTPTQPSVSEKTTETTTEKKSENIPASSR